MRLLVTILALVSLAACRDSAPERQEQEAPAPTATPDPAATNAIPATPAPSPPAPSNVPITTVDELVGEYRIAGAGGREIDLPHAITARIDDTGIIVTSGCVKLSWVWFFEDGRLATEQLFPRESCGRPLLPEEDAIVTAFNSANAIGRTPANGIEFSGGGHSVLLFGQ